MIATASFATIQRKSTGQILFAIQCTDQYKEVSFYLSNLPYHELQEMSKAGWDEPKEFKHHEGETENYVLEFIEKEIEL